MTVPFLWCACFAIASSVVSDCWKTRTKMQRRRLITRPWLARRVGRPQQWMKMKMNRRLFNPFCSNSVLKRRLPLRTVIPTESCRLARNAIVSGTRRRTRSCVTRVSSCSLVPNSHVLAHVSFRCRLLSAQRNHVEDFLLRGVLHLLFCSDLHLVRIYIARELAS